MLETMREYALERLAERGDGEAVRRRHAGFYLRLAEEAEPALLGPEQLRWARRLDSERGNLRAALTLGRRERRGRGRPANRRRRSGASGRCGPPTSRAASISTGCSPPAPARRRSAPSRRDGLRPSPSTRVISRPCVATSRRACPVFRELGDDANLSGHLGVLAFAAIADGDDREARALAEEALAVAQQARDPMKEAYALSTLGWVLAEQGKLDESQRVVEESIRRARELGNVRSVASWTKALGGITFLQGNYPRARELFEQSLAILRSLDDAWGTQGSLTGLALVALEEHDTDSVRGLLDENFAILREPPPLSMANVLEIAARLAAAEDRDRRAARLFGAASVFRGPTRTRMTDCEPRPDPAPHIARLRATLGKRAFAETWAEGTAMTLDQALAYAQDEADIERA